MSQLTASPLADRLPDTEEALRETYYEAHHTTSREQSALKYRGWLFILPIVVTGTLFPLVGVFAIPAGALTLLLILGFLRTLDEGVNSELENTKVNSLKMLVTVG